MDSTSKTTSTHTEIMVTLGVFDDHDVAPTIVFGVIFPTPLLDTIKLLQEVVEALVAAAAVEYGRLPPVHAQFWSALTKEIEDDE